MRDENLPGEGNRVRAAVAGTCEHLDHAKVHAPGRPRACGGAGSRGIMPHRCGGRGSEFARARGGRRVMSSLMIASVMFACVLASAVVAILVARRLPGHHLGSESRDTIKLGLGVIATLTALVL